MTRPDIRIRPASDADGPDLARVIATIFADYPNCHFIPDEFPELAAPATHYSGRGGRLWVAEAGGAAVGSFAVTATTAPGVFELFKVYLLRDCRGSGTAGAMLDEALAFARSAGGHRLRLWTDTRFTEGHRFYERNGFVRVPGSRAVPDGSDTWEYAYSRPLAAPRP